MLRVLVTSCNTRPCRFELIAPRHVATIDTSRGFLPFQFTWQTPRQTCLPGQFFGICNGGVPIDLHDGQSGVDVRVGHDETTRLLVTQIRQSGSFFRGSSRGQTWTILESFGHPPVSDEAVEKLNKFGIGHRKTTNDERIDPYASSTEALTCIRITSRNEPPRGNVDIVRPEFRLAGYIDGKTTIAAWTNAIPMRIATNQYRIRHIATTWRG